MFCPSHSMNVYTHRYEVAILCVFGVIKLSDLATLSAWKVFCFVNRHFPSAFRIFEDSSNPLINTDTHPDTHPDTHTHTRHLNPLAATFPSSLTGALF